MIIIVSQAHTDITLHPGDSFNLEHTMDLDGHRYTETVISETVKKGCHIDYAASFVFAAEDGTVTGNNICGIFGEYGNLPDEIKNAVYANDLPMDKKQRFIESSLIGLNSRRDDNPDGSTKPSLFKRIFG